MSTIIKNKRALHEYQVVDTYEAGIVLTGDEIKCVRSGSVSLSDSFGVVKDGEIMLLNCYIAPYSHAYDKKDRTRRSRKLLLKRKEINYLIGEVSRKGMTLIPMKMYFNKRNFAKVTLGVAKHKNVVNRKKELKERDISREASREIKMNIK